MEFGSKLKELRAEKGVSQAKLAADIHISRPAVAKWGKGLGLPNDESLKLLSEYFGVSIDERLPDKPTAETIVSKNKTVDQQWKVIIGLSMILSGIVQSDYVFCSLTGGILKPGSKGKRLQRLLESCGMEKIRFHDLRHTFATLALQNGVDV